VQITDFVFYGLNSHLPECVTIKKQVVETTCESHEKNSITATGFI
jgi:hypothetical protein